MNQLWSLMAEPPGMTGSVKLISQRANRVDYIPSKDRPCITLEIVFFSVRNKKRRSLPLVFCKRNKILTFSITACSLDVCARLISPLLLRFKQRDNYDLPNKFLQYFPVRPYLCLSSSKTVYCDPILLYFKTSFSIPLGIDDFQWHFL